jgi:hypothetical protein
LCEKWTLTDIRVIEPVIRGGGGTQVRPSGPSDGLGSQMS